MPRGVAIPELRQQLFAAAERVIVRDGAGRLSGRAITGEAGVATGLLYAHFADLDEFLAAFAVDRSFEVATAAGALTERVGSGNAAANLCDAVLAIPRDTLTALARLLVLRPKLQGRVQSVLGDRAAGLDTIEQAAAAYLKAEQRSGRLGQFVDPDAVALALVAVIHHLVLTGAPNLSDRLRRTAEALTGNALKGNALAWFLTFGADQAYPREHGRSSCLMILVAAQGHSNSKGALILWC